MSSDGYFDGDDDFDESALAQLDAIEAAHFSPGKQNAKPPTTTIPATLRPTFPAKENSFCDLSFDVDESELAQLDNFIEDAYQGKAKPVAGPSKTFSRASSSNKLQTTLFGEVLQPTASSSTTKPKSQMQRTKSAQRNPFGQQARKTKQWDQTAFAKSGVKQPKSKKGKGRAGDDDDSEEEAEEFEQYPAPFVSLGPPPPMKLAVDLLEAKHWIYPLNRPKRDYQYNIVKHCLFENTLVALPTGLGKTFIAGVVMLNYYRWFPEGKVIFVAPTKPLVAQQVTACHETCGIPGSDSIELTGEVPRPARQRYWSEKRVFFMTPQTLVNDLVRETCDARDIVLLVIDEAHRGTGDYAYNQVIRFLMAKNPHFRVLALTATPGNSTESVQKLVDGLHISRIEIRNEESLDLKPYIHKKTFVPHIIQASPTVVKIRNLIINVMNPLMKPILGAGVMRPGESPVSMHPFRPQMLMKELAPHNRRFYTSLSMLSKLARAMLYLLTGSIESCYEFSNDIANEQTEEDEETGKKKAPKGKKLKDDPNFRILMQELEVQRSVGFDLHPKMEELLGILIQHFGKDDEASSDTRVMVFSSYRGVVDRIVQELCKHKPLLRATQFIGQGTDKQGRKGLTQKEQLKVLEKFKAGEYNILVATSIGEEGLDIGEIDITICYDADKAPTRMIQRFGRTGRKREGTIHALLAEEREEFNIEKAEGTYREVQKLITRGEMYELYGDVERLIPEHMKPECVEKVVEIQQYVREKNSPKRAPATQGAKRKRNDDIGRNIPDGASKGFVPVSQLIAKGSKKQKKTVPPKDFEECGEDDDTDQDIETGRVVAPPRHTKSAAAGPSTGKTMGNGKLKKSATINEVKAPKARKKKVQEPTLSQLEKQGHDDADDMDIELGAVSAWSLSKNARRDAQSPMSEDSDVEVEQGHLYARVQTPPQRQTLRVALSPVHEPYPDKNYYESIIELTDSEHGQLTPQRSTHELSPSPIQPSPSKNSENNGDQDMGWLVDDDEDNLQFEIIDSSPIAPKRSSPFERVQFGDESLEISRPMPSNHIEICRSASETLVEDSIEFIESKPVAGYSRGKGKQVLSRSSSPEVLVIKDANIPTGHDSPVRTVQAFSSPIWKSSSPLYPGKEQVSMPPPALPRKFLVPGDSTLHGTPESTYPIRPIVKRRRMVFEEAESPSLEAPSPSRRRLRRIESTPVRAKDKAKKKTKRAKPSLLAKNVNPLFDAEAGHSGDEVSEGRSGSEDDEESESDRLFIKDSPATQASPSYEQTRIYRQSLMTQARDNIDGPFFANHPIRGRPFGRIDGPRMQHDGLPSSSPSPHDEELDNYEFGSFVVHDDADISYTGDD